MSAIHWRRCFQAAETESDPNQLASRVSGAKMAIVARHRELADGADLEEGERQSLNDAIRVLRKIEVERLGYPQVEDERGDRY